MKRLIAVFACVCVSQSCVLAALNVGGAIPSGVVQDDNTGYYWLMDLSGFNNKTYAEQVAQIAALNTGAGSFGSTSWHMASRADINSMIEAYSVAEILARIPPNYTNPAAVEFLTARYDEEVSSPSFPNQHYFVSMQAPDLLLVSPGGPAGMDNTLKSPQLTAWAVTGDMRNPGITDPPLIVDPGQEVEFQYYELTLEAPDYLEGEPGTLVEVPLDIYLTAATHTVYAVELVWPTHGHSGSGVIFQQTIEPKEIPLRVYGTIGVYRVPTDGSSLTVIWELEEARVDGPWGWVTSVMTNKKEITIAPTKEPPPTTGHHGGDRFSPLAECAACHGADLTGAPFGAVQAPSCYDCHGPLWISLPPVVVDAGPDQHVSCGGYPCSTSLVGTIDNTDAGPGFLMVKWITTRAPGTVVLNDPTDLQTTVSFDSPGRYILQLNANDGTTSGSDLVTIEVGLEARSADGSCDPLVHLPLDNDAGSIAYDVSAHDYNGTLVGNPAWIEGPPGFGSALAFTRTNYVELIDESPFDLTDTITVAAWACIDQIGAQWSPIVAKGNSAWRLSTVADQRRFHFAVTGPAAGPHWVNGVTDAGFGEWHHLAGTYDGEQIRLYVDGAEDPASPVSYAGPISTNDYPVWIGGNAQFPGQGFIGKIDDVRVFGRALSQAEIQGLQEPEGLMWVHEVIDNGPIINQAACVASLDGPAGTMVDYSTSVLNILDGGENGHFANDNVFGVVEQGLRNLAGVDNLALEVLGTVRIAADQAGDWTFGINSDDGFGLLFPEKSFDMATNGELISFLDGNMLRYSGNRSAQDTLGTIHLSAGDHPFWLIYHEYLGGAGLEFSAAPGMHKTFDPEVFRLVGQRPICDLAVPGLCGHVDMIVTQPGAWGAVRNLTDARSALAQGQQTQVSTEVSVINHSDPDFGGPTFGGFPHDTGFPNDIPGRNEDDFAVQVTGQLDIPVHGTYQIGFNSDDGVSLRINGQTWAGIIEDATGHAVIRGDELINDSITGRSFTVAEIELSAGCHLFEAIMFERNGGAFFELLGRGVSPSGVPDPAWHLLKVGGAQFPAQVRGLQLVP